MVRQEWRSVTFVHWPVPIHELASVVPDPLTVETIDDVAWVTLSLFSTSCRVFGWASLPGPAMFPETNVRTYVRAPDGSDGLYFLSLDVTNRSNALLGRCLTLPYHVSDMVMRRPTPETPYIRYAGIRRKAVQHAAYDVGVCAEPHAAHRVEALDTFLTGRWSAYFRAGGVLFRCKVEHEPWPLHMAQLVHCRQTLARTTGGVSDADVKIHYSPGVSTRLSWPAPLRSRSGFWRSTPRRPNRRLRRPAMAVPRCPASPTDLGG
jgi:hypothetical protein